MFEKIYEDKTFGRLSPSRFKKLSEKYEEESSVIETRINEIETLAKLEKQHEDNAEKFIGVLNKYSKIESMTHKLTSTLLHDFIEKIVVYHREDGEVGKDVSQKVEIFFKYVGEIKLPILLLEQRQKYLKVFSRVENQEKEKTLPIIMVM